MSDIRRIFLGERRMSFKALNDAKRQQALVPFLQVAECLHGVCCSIAVAKTVPHFATSPDTMSGLTDVMNLGGRWKEKTFETATRALLFWSVLISEVGEGQQNVTWLIDEDEIAANEPRHDDLLQLTARVGQHLIRRQMRELCVSTTATAGPNPMYEDFNAVADIAAGAFSEAVNRWTRRTSNDVSPDGTYDLFGHSGKCDLINDWFFFPSTTLRRVAVLVDHEPAGGISIKRVGLQT